MLSQRRNQRKPLIFIILYYRTHLHLRWIISNIGSFKANQSDSKKANRVGWAQIAIYKLTELFKDCII